MQERGMAHKLDTGAILFSKKLSFSKSIYEVIQIRYTDGTRRSAEFVFVTFANMTKS